MSSPTSSTLELKRFFLVVEEEQWVDTFTWDDSSRAMVPLLHEGDVAEIQVVARPQGPLRVNHVERQKRLTPVRESDAVYRISGLVLKRKLYSPNEGGGSYGAMVALLDCSVPLLCNLNLPPDRGTAEILESSEWLAFDAVLYGEISYTTMPLTAPLAAQILSISARSVTDDDFGNPHVGYHVLEVQVRHGGSIAHSFSRLAKPQEPLK